ncbi:PREDICTED: uncharacterized protein LOC103903786 [Aptenodytes forsteri]|nr:PREDICTED: uncharacterized protein LOC103903786 [Aptenodytes forsteri]
MLQNVENSTVSLGARDTHAASQVKYWGQTVLGNVYLEAGMVQAGASPQEAAVIICCFRLGFWHFLPDSTRTGVKNVQNPCFCRAALFYLLTWQVPLSAQKRGGNQRELARQKNLKKTQETHKGKRKEDSLSASQRKQRDSEIMQQKQKAANERKSLQAGAK